MPVITDEVYNYNGAPQAIPDQSGGRRKKIIGGTRDEELISLMEQQVSTERLVGKRYYTMSTYFCLRDQPDEFYQTIMQKMLECAQERFSKLLEKYVEQNVPKETAESLINNILSKENISHAINNPIGPLNANNYIGKLNLLLFQCLLVFNRNENKEGTVNTRDNEPPKVQCELDELGNTDTFAHVIFDNWLTKLGQGITRDFYGEFYPLFFYLTGLEKDISSFEIDKLTQYSPKTPPQTYITLFHIVPQFSLGSIINGYVNKINYVGFSSTNTIADGALFSPFGFMFHDLVHGENFRGERALSSSRDVSKYMKDTECSKRLNDDFSSFYIYCESLPVDSTMHDIKYSDLYKVQLVLFMLYHEQIFCYDYEDPFYNCRRAIERKSKSPIEDINIYIWRPQFTRRFSPSANDLNGLLPADIRNDQRRYTAYLDDCALTFSTLLYKFMSGKEVDSSSQPEKRQRLLGGRRKLTCRRKKGLSHKRTQKRRNSCFSRRNKKSRK